MGKLVGSFHCSYIKTKRKLKHCRVNNCHNTSKYPGTAFKFCLIPSVPERRRQWSEAIGLDLSNCNTYSAVCSDHFDPEDLVWNGKSWRANLHAVPQKYLNGMRRCVVQGCPNFEKEKGFQKFPSFKISEKWIAFTKRKNFKPSPSSLICSDHFSLHQYNGEHLKWDAVPDVEGIKEEWDAVPNVEGIKEEDEENDENIDQCEKVPENKKSAAPTQTVTSESSFTRNNVDNKLWVVDQIVEMKPNSVSSDSLDNPFVKTFLPKSRIPLEVKDKRYRTKIKMLNQKVRRRDKIIASMNNLIHILKNRLKHCKCDIDDIIVDDIMDDVME